MFSNLVQLVTGRPPPGHDRRFVEEVRFAEALPARNRRVEKILLVCWLLIAAKCALVFWLVAKYHMPFNALWVNAPTVGFALLCTGLVFFRRE